MTKITMKDIKNWSVKINWAAKPNYYKSVRSTLSKSRLKISDFPKRKAKSILIDQNLIIMGFKKPIPQIFIMESNTGREYLVNTEGSDYPKYMIRLT